VEVEEEIAAADDQESQMPTIFRISAVFVKTETSIGNDFCRQTNVCKGCYFFQLDDQASP